MSGEWWCGARGTWYVWYDFERQACMGFRPAFLGFHNNPLHCTAPTTSYLLPPTSYYCTCLLLSSPLVCSPLRDAAAAGGGAEVLCHAAWRLGDMGKGQWAMGNGKGKWMDR